jgi:hypothetical protein
VALGTSFNGQLHLLHVLHPEVTPDPGFYDRGGLRVVGGVKVVEKWRFENPAGRRGLVICS